MKKDIILENLIKYRARDILLRHAKALKEIYQNCKVAIGNSLLVGEVLNCEQSVSKLHPKGELEIRDETLIPKYIDEYHKDAENKQYLINYINNFRTIKQQKRLKENTGKAYFCLYWGGDWVGHIIFEYEFLLKYGIKGLRKKVEKYAKINGNPDFYEALLDTCDAMSIYILKYRDALIEKSKICVDGKSEEYARLAKICEDISINGATSWHHAVQLLYFIMCFDGIDSPGRIDQALAPYYKDVEKEKAAEIFDVFWVTIANARAWNVCIGGVDKYGSDASNDVSLLVLDSLLKHPEFKAPNVTMRCHKKLPDIMWKKAVESIASGTGMPALYNDEIVVPALMELGIPLEDCRNYAMNGCNQIDIQGKSHMGLEDGELSLAKALELALNQGVCRVFNYQMGVKTKDPLTFGSYEDILETYKQQIEFALGKIVENTNVSNDFYKKTAPSPMRTLFIEGCIEKAKGYKDGGPLYNHGQILTEGLAETADSLACIKHFVYDTKKYKLKYLLDAMAMNFEGYEKLRLELLNCPHKFGNDDDYVDEIAATLIEYFYKLLLNTKCARGGILGGGYSTFERADVYGANLFASLDGRKTGETVADSAGACAGRDKKGPTALLNSVAKCPSILAKSGYVTQLKFDTHIFSTDEYKMAFIAMCKAFFNKKGQQLQINVVDQKMLKDAYENPGKYKNLIVRVGGFSEYFDNLSNALKQNVMQRTLHS